MLAYQWHADSGTPVVFLHGLLGSQQDWAVIIARLQTVSSIRPLTLDLCFHGESQSVACDDFIGLRSELSETLQYLIGDQPFWLVGYSLGGRTALDFTLNQPSLPLLGVILEGTNIGLETIAEKQSRWQNDCLWAARFKNEPLANVLADWYRQPVFADLSPCKRSDLVKKRQNNHGRQIARMLRATSLAKQPFYADAVLHSTTPIHFLVGEKDDKFRRLAETYRLPYHLIHQAGHNAHLDNPNGFVEMLLNIIGR